MDDIREARRAQLHALLAEQEPPRKKNLARLIRRSPSQVSQWLSGYRTITEDSAREIERNARKPERWLEQQLAAREPEPSYAGRAPPDLQSALEALGIALARDLDDDQRQDVADALAKLAQRRGRQRDQEIVLDLLEAGPQGKRRGAA